MSANVEINLYHMSAALERLLRVLGGVREPEVLTDEEKEGGPGPCLANPHRMPDGAVLDRWGRLHPSPCPGMPDAADVADTERNRQRMRARIDSIIRHYGGNPADCRYCGAPIYWVRTTQGKRAPYDGDARSHWATCPQAATVRARYRR